MKSLENHRSKLDCVTQNNAYDYLQKCLEEPDINLVGVVGTNGRSFTNPARRSSSNILEENTHSQIVRHVPTKL